MATSQDIPSWYTDAGKRQRYGGAETGDPIFTGNPYSAIDPIGIVQEGAPQQAKAYKPPTQGPLDDEVDVPAKRMGGLGGAPTAGLASAMPMAAMDTGPAMPMPGPTAAPTPQIDAPQQSTAMAGLQAAAPDQTPMAGMVQRMGQGALNPRLGQRNPPDGISGLKVLTY